MKFLFILAVLVLITATVFSGPGQTQALSSPIPAPAGPAPIYNSAAPAPGGKYIVVYKTGVQAGNLTGLKTTRQLSAALNGVAITGATASNLEALRADPAVWFIQQVGVYKFADNWGLDRINQRTLPLDGNLTITAGTGAGVKVFIVDTGILASHQEFGGRASCGHDFVGNGTCTDEFGHGTHVAGITAGATHGVAKQATIISVDVFNQEYTTTDVLVAALDWVAANKGAAPAVINLSLGGPRDMALNLAVANVTRQGIVVAVAAGNENTNACDYSPASAPEALTVGATQADDHRAFFSDWGECLDLFAPGVDIESSWNNGDQAYATLSGTSMATPFVTGFAAVLRGLHPEMSPAQISAWLLVGTTQGAVIDAYSPTNRLLYTGDLSFYESFLPLVQSPPPTRAPSPTPTPIGWVPTATPTPRPTP